MVLEVDGHHESTEDSSSSDSDLHKLYPPVSTALASLPREKRTMVLHAMLLLVLSLEHYSAYSRVLLLYIASSLRLSLQILLQDEEKVAQGLVEVAKRMSGDEEIEKRAEENSNARRWKVGIAGVAGAAIIGQ